jgi:hypothetical protein
MIGTVRDGLVLRLASVGQAHFLIPEETHRSPFGGLAFASAGRMPRMVCELRRASGSAAIACGSRLHPLDQAVMTYQWFSASICWMACMAAR